MAKPQENFLVLSALYRQQETTCHSTHVCSRTGKLSWCFVFFIELPQHYIVKYIK